MGLISTSSAEIAGNEIFYEVTGQGAPLVYLEQPEKFNQLVFDFLDKHEIGKTA